jgi:hypothetical protein
MSDNSFIPFCELREFPNGHKKKSAPSKKVLKNNKVQPAGNRKITSNGNGQTAHHEIECTSIMQDGVVVAIDVQCGCGSKKRIHLEYGD